MGNKITDKSPERDKPIYDAIVIGSGISGGWAAKELCQRGLKTLVLERGRAVEHIKDYTTANLNPWDFKNGMHHTQKDVDANPIRSLVSDPGDQHFYASDVDHPYQQEKPFNWIRSYQVGGRSLVWGRQCYRFSDLDFKANLKDGIGVDWPIRYKDLESWYTYVEKFIGVSGQVENLNHLPDGEFLPAMELNCIENHLKNSVQKNKDKVLTIARVANLTKGWDSRGPCQYRNLCSRGCPFGGYFSSNSATLPAAELTGNLTIRPNAIVKEIIYDEQTKKATGVVVIDAITMETHEFYSRIIFLNASTIATAAILLNSKSTRFPNGLGNDSMQIGHNLMDHHSSAGAYGVHKGFSDQYYKGRRPAGFLIPRFRNLNNKESNVPFLRGYNLQGHGERQEWQDRSLSISGFGKDFKNKLTTPGPWTVWMGGWGECLPYYENQINLDYENLDKWGLPTININFSFNKNEKDMMDDIMTTAGSLLADAGFTEIQTFNYQKPGGSTVHEMGTARMGHDPKTSVLNKYNQMHAVKNLFITDGSCMTSSACQNPSLTYMALTARACNYAANLFFKNEL
ncbi:GMC family oxidoreductase [Pedobacter agri]|uniref:GMC family oxidoreductase n=1 Tax=Pedobacter agri TaxID=454586 RepID=UPI00292F2375|nr:GMC family oxidoreductase [Pedobacter agri]